MEFQAGQRLGSFILEAPIGSGAMASVWRARHYRLDADVAVKIMSKSHVTTDVIRTRLQREISLLKKLDHPFIAEVFEIFDDADNFYIVQEFGTHGTLRDYVNGVGHLCELQARRYFLQVLSVLDYLHREMKVAHRDVKCENILLDRNDNVRVIDFGLSRQFSDFSPQMSTVCGSPAYAPPEMVKGEPYTRAADVWSLGVVLFAVSVGRLPFHGPDTHALLRKIVTDTVAYPPQLGRQLMDLLSAMLRKDPELRITLDGIVAHSWIARPDEAPIELDDLTAHLRPFLRASSDLIPEIVDRLRDAGYNVAHLHDELIAESFSELMCAYRILVRDRMADHINDPKIRRTPTTHPLPRRPSITVPASATRILPGVAALPSGALLKIAARRRSASQKESFREMPISLDCLDANP